ncbi:MAG: S8 family serine peptidase, partial [Rhodothermales bacterium]|nr:S8 family serine peptidase [Rhodothermales bacterium]
PNGVTRRVLDSYGITRRILNEYGVTRRVLEQYGVTRRVLEQYGVTRRVLESYSLALDVLEQYGVTRRVLDQYGQDITDEWLASLGITPEMLENHGVTRRVLDDYGVTRRVLNDYGLTNETYEAFLQAFERLIRLKVRIDGARPGIFIGLGPIPLNTFLEEIADDTDIAFVELDFPFQGPAVGQIQHNLGGPELLPWGIAWTGANTSGLEAAREVHVFVLDSGMLENDLQVAERKDFSMLFESRDESDWDDSGVMQMPFFDPGEMGNPEDETGHGTHIAGTIGALTNGSGVIGMAPEVRLHSLKVMNKEGKTDITTVVAAIDYVIVRKQHNPNLPMVMNLSLGMDIGTTQYNVLDEAVRRATEHGIVAVVSAGNDNRDASHYSPAHVAEAITVGAFDETGRLSRFSNNGSAVDILAPGEMIASLSHNPNDVAMGYGILESGTSMAAAHVSGAAARILASNPTATATNVKNALIGAAKPTILGLSESTPNRSLWIGPDGIENTMLPPHMQYAMASGDVLNLKQTVKVASPAGSLANANIYSGSYMMAGGADVEGFAYYVADSGMNYDSVFRPRYNPSAAPVGKKVDSVEIPQLDLFNMGQAATVRHRGDLHLEGRVYLGTREAPLITYVTGSVMANRDVTLVGYGVFVVEGSAWISKAMATDDENSMVAFYAGNDINVDTAHGTVDAHFYANRKVTVASNVTIRGSLVAGSEVYVQRHSELIYNPISCALTEPFWPVGYCTP